MDTYPPLGDLPLNPIEPAHLKPLGPFYSIQPDGLYENSGEGWGWQKISHLIQQTWKLIAILGDWHLSGSGRLEIYNNGHETVIHIGDRNQPCLFTQDSRFRMEM